MSTINYKCPSCGAGIGFDIETQKWACRFCGSVYDHLDEQTDYNQSEKQETFDDAVKFSCSSCGGEIITDAQTAATFCVYCHNPTLISERVTGEYRPSKVIPFALPKEDVIKSLRSYCRKRPLLPRDFRQYAEKGEVSGLYVPFWLFDAELVCHMDAEGKTVTTWTDTRYVYTKTDTYAVRREADIAFARVPADGSARMDDTLMEQLEPYDYKKLSDFDPAYLSGHFAEAYDVDAEKSVGRAQSRMKTASEQLVRNTIDGYNTVQVQNFSTRPLAQKHLYAMLPVWTLMARYKNKSYTYACNGQTGKIAGKLPVSWTRVFALLGIIGFAASLLLFLALFFTNPAAPELSADVLFVQTLDGKTPRDYADNYFLDNNLGVGPEKSGLLLLVSWTERDVYITTSGAAIRLFNDAEINRMLDALVPYLRNNDEAGAETLFRSMITNRLSGIRRAFSLNLLYALLGGLGLSLLSVGGMAIVHKVSFAKAPAGQTYLEPGGFHMTKQTDTFTHTHTTRVPIPKSNGGGGGGSSTHSTGGHSFGGGGRKF